MPRNAIHVLNALIKFKLANNNMTEDKFFCGVDDGNNQWEKSLLGNLHSIIGPVKFSTSDITDHTNQKSVKDSVHQREIGNNFNKTRRFTFAIESYSKSIALAPCNIESPALAFAFANRGAVLKTMGYLEDSIKDTIRALGDGYPKDLEYKLFNRLGQSYQQLGKIDEAKHYFTKALNTVEESPLSREIKSNLKSKINDDMETCIKGLGHVVIGEQGRIGEVHSPHGLPDASPAPPPRLSSGTNSESTCLSKNVVIKYTKTLGRHLVAAQDVKPGEVLLIETLDSFILDDEQSPWSHCSHCLLRCRTLIPCANCSWSMFCSEECLSEAQSYHKIECGMIPFVKEHFTAHFALALKILTRIKKEELMRLAEELQMFPPQSDEEWRTVGFDKNGKLPSGIGAIMSYYYKNKWRSSFELKSACIFIFAFMPAILNDTEINLDVEVFVLKFVHAMNLIKLHPIAEFEMNSDSVRYRTIGHNAPPMINLLDHSCNPNVMQHCHKTTAVVRAIQFIPKDSQIFLSHGRTFLRRTKLERQTYLKGNLRMECKCEVCKDDWPLLKDLPIAAIYQLPDEKRAMESTSLGAKTIMEKWFSDGDYIVTKESLPIFLRQIMVMGKSKKTLNQKYFEIVEAVMKYYAIQGNLFVNYEVSNS